jgi:hypothetical protein
MAILSQIKKSQLSKQGRTNTTGVFEGTPQNVAAVLRGSSVPLASSVIPPIQNPIDVTYNAKPQPTYLDYLKTANKS